jgi:hypothetical protein
MCSHPQLLPKLKAFGAPKLQISLDASALRFFHIFHGKNAGGAAAFTLPAVPRRFLSMASRMC